MRELAKCDIEWIKEIPSTWSIGKVLNFFYEGKTKNSRLEESNLLSLSYGKIIKKDINTSDGLLPQSFSTYNIVSEGDIIIRPTDLQNDKRSLRTGYVFEKGIITSAYIDLKPKKAVNSRYFHKLLHSYDICKVFYNMGNGVRQCVGFVDFSRLFVLVPPLSEQKAIADYLDDKCGQIDEIAKIIEGQIATLEQYKRSIITEKVTKGLDSSVLMKDSGIEWIGAIPAHWNVIRNKYIFDLDKEIIGKDWIDTQLLSLTKNGIKEINDGEQTGKVPTSYTTYQKVKINDIVMCLFDLDCSAVFSGVSPFNGMISPAYKCFKCKDIALPGFIDYYFRTVFIDRKYKRYSKNVRFSLSSDEFLALKIIVPPLSEQKAIADYLDDKCGQIDEIINGKKKQLETLKSYKQSIIYEYVTGKREVPHE